MNSPFFPKRFNRQFTGGSQGIRQGWKPLRTAGATARQMLHEAAAQNWSVPVAEISSANGMLHHKNSGKSASFGEMASLAATLPVPKNVQLKKESEFSIIGKSKKNVDLKNIITGKPLFGIDHKVPGMLYAMIVHPPAFGMRLKSVDAASVKLMPGIKDVFPIKIMNEEYLRNFFDTATFIEMVVIVGNSTWEVMQAKKNLNATWEVAPDTTFKMAGFQGNSTTQTIPGGLESTEGHRKVFEEMRKKPGSILRKDGNPEEAFSKAAKIIERT